VISYRYHLVSIIAIFLAIALGVVIGTSALNGAVVGDLRRQVSDLKHTNSDQASANKALSTQAGNADQLAKSFGSRIAGTALAKQSVVLVATPGASASVKDAVAAEITATGGQISGRVQLGKDFTDPARANDIKSLATSPLHPIGLQLPTTTDAGTLAGALLGYVLLGHGSASDLTQVLTGFSTLNMLKTENGAVAAGKAVVLISTSAMAKDDPAAATLLTFATEVGTLGGATVVAGTAASDTDGGLVAMVRSNPAALKALSSVDDADGALGQLTTAMAAADAIAGRKGHYGTGTDVDALMPGTAG